MTGIDNPETPAQPAATKPEAQQDAQPSQAHPDAPADTIVDSNVGVGKASVTDVPQPPSQTSSPPPSTMPPSNDTDTSSTPEPPVQDLPAQQPENPALMSLKAIFPDFDEAVLCVVSWPCILWLITNFASLSVLESVGGDQDRALDIILGMSDPDYVSQAAAEPTQPAPVSNNHYLSLKHHIIHICACSYQSQTELDEQFARQLLLEERIAHQAFVPPQPQPPPPPAPYNPAPYEARTHHGHFAQPPGPQQYQPQAVGPERDTMTELQEQFNKFAESAWAPSLVSKQLNS